MQLTAKWNSSKTMNNWRYSRDMQNVSLLMWFHTGGNGYGWLRQNLVGVLPSISSLARFKRLSLDPFPVGISNLTILEAAKYYRSAAYNCNLFTLAFDSTAIIPGMQYDEKNGNLVGIKSKNGEYCIPVENYWQIISTFVLSQNGKKILFLCRMTMATISTSTLFAHV
jgi:hypothetical protein